jgi:hypothetical protein
VPDALLTPPPDFASPMPEGYPMLEAPSGDCLPGPGTRLQGDNDEQFY